MKCFPLLLVFEDGSTVVCYCEHQRCRPRLLLVINKPCPTMTSLRVARVRYNRSGFALGVWYYILIGSCTGMLVWVVW